MKKLSIGILAHVDAGKTTLSEALLYVSGSIRKMGRVDNRDAFLDTDAMEKERGITIFSKQAEFVYRDMAVTLLDDISAFRLLNALGNLLGGKSLPIQTVHAPLHRVEPQSFGDAQQCVVVVAERRSEQFHGRAGVPFRQ